MLLPFCLGLLLAEPASGPSGDKNAGGTASDAETVQDANASAEQPPPADTAEGPVAEATPHASESNQEREAQPSANEGGTTDPFQKATVPGFPAEVDIHDESTWADLSPQEKDQLRAIRAGMRAKQAAMQPEEPAQPTGPDDDEEAPITAEGPRARSDSNIAWWTQRESNLKGATIAFGVTWGVSTVAATIIIATLRNNARDCSKVEDDGFGNTTQGSLEECRQGAEQSLNLVVPAYIVGTIAGASFIGTVISGALLGSHRNSRPFIVAGPQRLGLGFSGRF